MIVVMWALGTIVLMMVASMGLSMLNMASTPAVLVGAATVLMCGYAAMRWTSFMASKMLVLILAAVMLTGCTLARPGEVGIKVNNYGSSRGVDEHAISTGRIWYNPWTEDVYIFPTYIQRVVWQDDEAITFRSKEGMSVTADVGVALKFTDEGVPKNFVEFRKTADEIVDGYIRDRVRDTFGKHGNQMSMMDILGTGTQTLTDNVLADIQAELNERKIVLDSVSIIGKPRVDQQVEASINQVLQAVQKANEAEQAVRQATAQANSRIEAARGEAESITAVAKAQAEANRIIAESLRQYGDSVLQSKALDKWNGVLPSMMLSNGSVPFINVTK